MAQPGSGCWSGLGCRGEGVQRCRGEGARIQECAQPIENRGAGVLTLRRGTSERTTCAATSSERIKSGLPSCWMEQGGPMAEELGWATGTASGKRRVLYPIGCVHAVFV